MITETTVLAEVSEMIREVLDGYDVEDLQVGMDTSFHDDLEMESIDLVALGGQLTERYGDRVNFAEFIAGLDLDEIIELKVGRLVEYVVVAHAAPPTAQADRPAVTAS